MNAWANIPQFTPPPRIPYTNVGAQWRVENGILSFFDRNPSEELMTEDIAVKFGVRRQVAQAVAKAMHERGLIDRKRIPGTKARSFVYCRAAAAMGEGK